jgi:hypothetical protein
MGTAEEDFEPLRRGRAAPAAIRAMVAGVPFEDLLTGYGVAVAAETALGEGAKGPKGSKGLNGHTVAIEGFGKVGGGVAREVGRRGGRVVAVSTVAGCVSDPSGLDVGRLLTLRRTHGDACVLRYGRPVLAPHQLFTEVNADVLVPGTRPGAIDAQTARSLPPGVRVIAPAANAPYTAAGAEVLRQRGIVALPDFVCNAGAVIGYRSAVYATPDQVLAKVEARIGELIRAALGHPGGPLAGACEQAGGFLRSWWGEPPGPPFAPAELRRTSCRPGTRSRRAVTCGPSRTGRSRRRTWTRSWRRAAGPRPRRTGNRGISSSSPTAGSSASWPGYGGAPVTWPARRPRSW